MRTPGGALSVRRRRAVAGRYLKQIDFDAPLRGRPLLGYGLATATFAAALLARFALDGALPPGFPFLTFFPAVIATAFLAGPRAGVLCAVLGGLAAWWFFIPPVGIVLTGSAAVALLFYLFIVAVNITLIHAMQLSLARLKAERAVNAGLYEQQRTMFQELQHRVANNMTFVSALLRLQKREVTKRPETARDALEAAETRLDSMARIHRRLYDPASIEQPVGEYLRELGQDLLKAAGAREVVFTVEADPVRFDVDRLMTLSLLLAELVTNSLKHAFVGREGGVVAVRLTRLDDNRLELSVRDDGVGLSAAAAEAGPGRGLGRRIVQALVRQLGGTLTVDGTDGVVTRVTLPA